MASDLALLPSDLASRSLSTREIVLCLDDAIAAVEHLARGAHRLEGWEGWVQLPGGGRARSLEHQGPFILPSDAGQAAARAIEQMRGAQATWDRRPEYEGGRLYFCLVLAAR